MRGIIRKNLDSVMGCLDGAGYVAKMFIASLEIIVAVFHLGPKQTIQQFYGSVWYGTSRVNLGMSVTLCKMGGRSRGLGCTLLLFGGA